MEVFTCETFEKESGKKHHIEKVFEHNEWREEFIKLFCFQSKQQGTISWLVWTGGEDRGKRAAVDTKEQIKPCHLHTDMENRLLDIAGVGEEGEVGMYGESNTEADITICEITNGNLLHGSGNSNQGLVTI